MDADFSFLIFYWVVCIIIVTAFYLLVGVELISMFAGGVVIGFACAMTLTFLQESREKGRFHYGKH